MKAYIFPGQGAQSPGMGKDLYNENKNLFDQANSILGFELSKIMFEGSMEDLTKTKVTQPAVFLHSVVKAISLGSDFEPSMSAHLFEINLNMFSQFNLIDHQHV